MSSGAFLFMIISLLVSWGGVAVCLVIAIKKKS